MAVKSVTFQRTQTLALNASLAIVDLNGEWANESVYLFGGQ